MASRLGSPLVKQWVFSDRKAKNPVVIQSMRLVSQLVFSTQQNPEGGGHSAGKEENFLVLYIGCQFRVGLWISHHPDLK